MFQCFREKLTLVTPPPLFFTPPPFCFAYETTAGWLGLERYAQSVENADRMGTIADLARTSRRDRPCSSRWSATARPPEASGQTPVAGGPGRAHPVVVAADAARGDDHRLRPQRVEQHRQSGRRTDSLGHDGAVEIRADADVVDADDDGHGLGVWEYGSAWVWGRRRRQTRVRGHAGGDRPPASV